MRLIRYTGTAPTSVLVLGDGGTIRNAEKLYTVQNSAQNFPDSWGKQCPKVSTQDHAIIQRLSWRIWGIDHGSDCQNSISPFGGQGEHQRDRA